jgi:hypothetical protein
MPEEAETIEEMLIGLQRSSWSIGSTAFANEDGNLVWLVSGHNGANLIRAEGATELEAWRAAADQARSLGMLDGWRYSKPSAG